MFRLGFSLLVVCLIYFFDPGLLRSSTPVSIIHTFASRLIKHGIPYCHLLLTLVFLHMATFKLLVDAPDESITMLFAPVL